MLENTVFGINGQDKFNVCANYPPFVLLRTAARKMKLIQGVREYF